jgi:hypothetical protein
MQFSVLTDDNWLLTVGTFLPLVGVLIMMFIPASEETTHKQIAVVTAGATLAVGILDADPLRLRRCRVAAVLRRTRSGSRSSARATRSASTASACRSTSCRWR